MIQTKLSIMTSVYNCKRLRGFLDETARGVSCQFFEAANSLRRMKETYEKSMSFNY